MSGFFYGNFRLRSKLRRGHPVRRRKNRADYLLHKEIARSIVAERLDFFLTHYETLGHPEPKNHLTRAREGGTGGRIAVRDQRSRWGSCSQKANLNFNYRIVHLRSELRDYIIVHELCHLKEFNHAQSFWDLVALTVPNWQVLRAELQKMSLR